MYHGTAPDNVSPILKSGIQSAKTLKKPSLNTSQLKNVLGSSVANEGEMLAYATPSKMLARIFALQAEHGGVSNTQLKMALKEISPFEPLKAAISSRRDKSVITASIPKWKANIVNNPESAMYRKRYGAILSDKVISKLEKNLNNLMPAFEGGIPAEYIKGSKKYIPWTKEIGQYVKAKPGRFAAGLGVGLAGLSLAGIGASNMIKPKHEMEKRSSFRQIKERAFLDELNKLAQFPGNIGVDFKRVGQPAQLPQFNPSVAGQPEFDPAMSQGAENGSTTGY